MLRLQLQDFGNFSGLLDQLIEEYTNTFNKLSHDVNPAKEIAYILAENKQNSTEPSPQKASSEASQSPIELVDSRHTKPGDEDSKEEEVFLCLPKVS